MVVIRVPFDHKKVGFVIGRGGENIKTIQQKSDTRIQVKDEIPSKTHAEIRGAEDACKHAKKLLEEHLKAWVEKEEILDQMPSSIIQKIFKRQKEIIENQTDTRLKLKGNIMTIRGSTENRQKARIMIKNSVNKLRLPNFKVLTFYDETNTAQNSYFKLQEENPPGRIFSAAGKYYKLVEELKCESAVTSTFTYVEELNSVLLDLLRGLKKGEDTVEVDLWCHFGHGYIYGPSQELAEEKFSTDEVRRYLTENSNGGKPEWKTSFFTDKVGIKITKLRTLFERNPQKKIVAQNKRCDLHFLTPSANELGLKVWIDSEIPEPVANTVNMKIEKTINGNTINGFLCGSDYYVGKFNIIAPGSLYDYRINLRLRNCTVERDVVYQEESRILWNWIHEHINIQDGWIHVPDDKLPPGFDLDWRRESNRVSFEEGDFTLMFSEDKVWQITNKGQFEKSADVHIDNKEWDEKLASGEWEPEEILSNEKLQHFLSFVHEVRKRVPHEDDGEISG